MDRVTKQIIKCKVMQYPALLNKFADDFADIAASSASGGVAGGKSSVRNSRGFDSRLVSLMGNEDYLWCEAIESAVKYFNERGQKDVVKAVDGLYWKCGLNADGVAMQICVCRKQVYNYVDNFFEILHKFALKNGATAEI